MGSQEVAVETEVIMQEVYLRSNLVINTCGRERNKAGLSRERN